MSLQLLLRAAELAQTEDRFADSVVPQYTYPTPVRQHPYQRYAQTGHKAVTMSYNHATIAVPKKEALSESDDATDEDNTVPTVPSAKPKPSRGGIGANAHNEVEKRRRAYLTACYTELHTILPQISGTKASNATVLRSATEHIKALEREEKMLLAAKKRELRKRQEILARQSRGARALQHRRKELMAAALQVHMPQQIVLESPVHSQSEDEGAATVPDNASRPVSPNLSPKEDLTQLASPLRAKDKGMLAKNSGSNGGPIRRTGRARVRSIMLDDSS